MKISEVNISFVTPCNGLIGFASLVINNQIYIGSIAIHQRLDGRGYRLTYPTKKSNLTDRPLFHPINRKTSSLIETAIFEKLKNVMRKCHDRHSCNHIR